MDRLSVRQALVALSLGLAILFVIGCASDGEEVGPDLPSMALSEEDVPGFTVDTEGYEVWEPGATATFDRNLSASTSERFGESQVFFMNSHIELFASSKDAQQYLLHIAYQIHNGAEIFVAGFADGTSVVPAMREWELLDLPGLGDAAVGVRAMFESPYGAHGACLILVRVGRATSALIVGAATTRVRVDEVLPLVRMVVERMESGLDTGQDPERTQLALSAAIIR